MKLADLPDIEFVEVDAEAIKQEIFDCYTSFTGRTVERSDPIRLFLLFIAEIIIRQRNNINDTGKQNLLKYSAGDNLDNLAANMWTARLQAEAATTTLQATLSAVREKETVIPAGTRVSPTSEIYFATDSALVIPAGGITGTVSATCTETGTIGNDYAVGEISKIVDPVAYVDTIANITVSAGGSNVEEDDSLRARVWEAPETLSVAGPGGAYRARAMAVSSLITDVDTGSPSPGVAQISILLKDGKVPEQELLQRVQTALSSKTVRPLTDKVVVAAAEPVKYNIAATYQVDGDADAMTVQKNVLNAVQEYVSWQQSEIGQNIDPSKLTEYMRAVRGTHNVVVTEPQFTILQKFGGQTIADGKSQYAKLGSMSVSMAGDA